METITVQITNAMRYDRLHTLSAEYDLPTDLLVNIAIQRLLDDVELVRRLRIGKVQSE